MRFEKLTEDMIEEGLALWIQTEVTLPFDLVLWGEIDNIGDMHRVKREVLNSTDSIYWVLVR